MGVRLNKVLSELNIGSFEKTQKSFGFLLTYSYLCQLYEQRSQRNRQHPFHQYRLYGYFITYTSVGPAKA